MRTAHPLLCVRSTNPKRQRGGTGIVHRLRFGLVVCGTFILLHPTLADETPQKAESPQQDERLSRETPEGTLRVFTIGVLRGVEDLIKKTSLPVSDEEMKLICVKAPEDAPSFKEVKDRVASMKIRSLKAGDKFTLPGNKEIVVAKEEVSEDRLVLVLEDAPVPTRMYKAKGFWWVDPEPLIHARRAVANSKEKSRKSTNK